MDDMVAQHTDSTGAHEPSAPFQPMPPLTPEQDEALRAHITAHGIIVPVVVDQHGRILDGHNRARIADELGIDCPRETRAVADDDEAADLAVTLNCARRHLTREQVRYVIAGELARRPGDSDRAIARRVGCSPSTVAVVRTPQVSNLDTPRMSRAEAEAFTEQLRAAMASSNASLLELIVFLLSRGVPAAEVITALTAMIRSIQRSLAGSPELGDWVPRYYALLIDDLLDPATVASFRQHGDHEPLDPTVRAILLTGLANAGGGR